MIKNIILDFDGVILESNDIKVDGFYELFLEFGEESALMISQYFKKNAGFSRYDIIRYFFLKLYDENINELKLQEYAGMYSELIKDKVIKSKFVDGCEEFILKNQTYKLFIVSSSDENDLKYICDRIGITKYFKAVLGSPIKKETNISNIITMYNLQKSETIYIGDTMNDYKATIKNDLVFIGRNSGICDFSMIDNILVVDDLREINSKIKEL